MFIMKTRKTEKSQPESLAQFGKTARDEPLGPSEPGLTADHETSAIPTNPKLKHKAATKVLREGAYQRDEGSQEEIDKLPDRILDKKK
jgi:hypothetical protein